MRPISECRLYTFIDTMYLRGRSVVEIARQLCDGGSDIIQLRAKSSPTDEIQRMAESVERITEPANVHLVVNDDIEVSRTMRHPFCHLGQEDFFDSGLTHVSQLQTRREPLEHSLSTSNVRLQVGLSTHSPAQAQRAIAAGPDYLAIGPVFATGTKPMTQPVTLEYVRWAAANVPLVWFAIGGITLDRLDDLIAAGARRICVVSAILNARNVAKACQAFRERLFSASL